MLATLIGILPVSARPRVAVIAHRGEHLEHPENSLAGIEVAAKIGVDYVEMDIRTSMDGALVLMHDARVDRTTNGKGRVAEMTANQIRALELQGGGRVPLFAEALEVLRRTETGVYLDAKGISARDIRRSLAEQRMLERTVIYGSVGLLKELAAAGEWPRVMPEARSVETLKTLLGELKPKVIAFDRSDWQAETIAVARAAGVELFLDSLGAEDTPQHWEEAIRRGATGIQTDHPAALVASIRK